MALEYEKLKDQIKSMGIASAQRRDTSTQLLDMLQRKLERYAEDWDHINHSLAKLFNENLVDKQKYRAARPLFETEPLDTGIDPPQQLPDRATLIAIDGSQAIPSRHDAHMYFLINIGLIVYEHGGLETPIEYSDPRLAYLGDGVTEEAEEFRSNVISVKRDMAEIETLARQVWEHKYKPAPILAILDQRLQYFPIGVNDKAQSSRYVERWVDGMNTIKSCGALLAGYIERPETGAVIQLLNTLDVGEPSFRAAGLLKRSPIYDAALFGRILHPGQRTALFEVINGSTNYQPFLDANQEICFFYYRPPGRAALSRVDIPKWAAQQPEVVDQIHGLLHNQSVLGVNYPYVLTRADEIAVVRGKDRTFLDQMIAIEMAKHGIYGNTTGKQGGKNLTRSTRRNHAL